VGIIQGRITLFNFTVIPEFLESLKKNAAPSPARRQYRIKRYVIGYGTSGEVIDVITSTSEYDALQIAKKQHGLKEGEMLLAELLA
jgi:hypothetical protein